MISNLVNVASITNNGENPLESSVSTKSKDISKNYNGKSEQHSKVAKLKNSISYLKKRLDNNLFKLALCVDGGDASTSELLKKNIDKYETALKKTKS